MDFIRMIESYALWEVAVDDLPAAATEALIGGFDSPSLCQLAGAELRDPEEIRRFFHNALAELNIRIPSPVEVQLIRARRIARDIVNGTISPYSGARQIWWDIYNHFPDQPERMVLVPFVHYAGEYEDNEQLREHSSQQIIEQSKKLLEELGPEA